MSPSPYPLFSISCNDKPENIKCRTKLLIQLYLQHPDSSIANAIAQHIAAMLAFPKFIKGIEERCLFRRLEMHWRCLTWTT